LRGEHLSAVGGDDPVVFEADAELAGDVDAGLVGEGHAGEEWRGVAADEIGPLVAIHPDAVADAVAEVFVVGAEACIADDLAGCGVDGLTLHTGMRCGEGCSLGFVDDVEDLLLLVGGFAEDEGARHVGLVTFDGAAVVDEDDLALADDLRLEGAVGQGRVLGDLAAGVAGEADAVVGGGDELAELAVGHAGLCGFVDGFVDVEGDVVGEAHEGQLGGSFDAAAAEGDGGSADSGEGGAGVGDAVGEGELGALLDADLSGGDACFLQCFGDESVGVLVFVPGVDLGVGRLRKRCGFGFHALADAAFFEDWADDEGASFDGEDPGEEALGLAPTQTGEVVERGAGGDDEGVDLVLGEKLAGAFDALLALFECDGHGFGAAAGERGDWRGELEVGWGRCGGALGLKGE